MKHTTLAVEILKDTGDERGRSFPVNIESIVEHFRLRDAHIATLVPGRVRGNHYHVGRDELLLITYTDAWSLHWDSGADTPIQRRRFDGSGAVVVAVPPHCSHAIRNDGRDVLYLTGLSTHPYDPARPDAIVRNVVAT